MKPFVTLRRSLLLASLLIGTASIAQTTIFLESMGTVTANTAIATHDANGGFDNSATLTYTGTGDLRNTTVSSGYTGASGSANVFLTNNGTASFQISGVNTLDFTNLTLSFGAYKNTNASNLTELLVEVSTDGVNYSTLTFPAQPTGSGTAIWRLVTITGGTIPATSNLRIRWTNTSTGPQLRIDDVRLAGDPVVGAPSLSADPTVLSFGSLIVGNTASDEFEVSGSDLSPASGDITVTAPGGLDFQVSLDNSTWTSSVNIAYTGASLSATTVYVRFAPSTIGAQNGNVAVSGGGASTFNVGVTGNGVPPQIYWDFTPGATPTIDGVVGISTSAISRANTSSSTDLIETAVSSSGYSGASGGANATSTVLGTSSVISTTGYFQWSHTPAFGSAVVVTEFRFGTRRSGTGPTAYVLRSSADNYQSDIATGSIEPNTTWVLREHTGLNVVGALGQPLTFRLYGVGGSASSITGAANWRIDDVQVIGQTIQPAAVYFSQGSGNVNAPIWSSTPVGAPGPAIFTANSSMVVQPGHTVTVNANTSVNDLTLESGATITVNTERLLSVWGTTIDLAGTVTPTSGEIELVGFDAATINITGTVSMWDLTVANFSGVTVNGNLDMRGTLLVADGDLDATNATVRLLSDASGTARLGPVGPGAAYIGNLTAQRYIPGGATNWRLLGSGVAGATVAQWNDDFFTAGFPGSNFPNFIVDGQPWPSIRKYDETNTGTALNDGLIGVAGTSEALVPGRGYAAWSGDNLGGTAPFTVSVTGNPTVAQSPLDLPVSWTDSSTPTVDGWNLVSNPLASPVDFSSFTLGNDMTEGYYVYDPATGNSAFWDEDSQTSTPAEAGLNGVIQSAQGFWLKANGNAAAASLDENAKVSGQLGGLFGGNTTPVVPSVQLRITAANGMLDEARVVFNNGTPALDTKDAFKLEFAHASAPRIATRTTDGHDLIVNRYGAFASDISIPVTVRVPANGSFTIRAGISGLDFLSCFSLEDLVTGTITPLTDGVEYVFTMDGSPDIVADRFVLHASAPMPYTVTDALCGGSATGQVAVEVPAGPVDLVLADVFGNAVQEAMAVGTGIHVFDAIAAGNYLLLAPGTTACGTLSANITILEPFFLEADVQGTVTTCPDSQDGTLLVELLGGEGPYTFAWSNGGDDAQITDAAGTYSVLVTDANGCTLQLEGLEIVPGDGPVAGFELANTTVLVGEELELINTSMMADGWYWEFGDGTVSEEETPVHSYQLPGQYTITLYAYGNNCESLWTVDVSVQVSTSVAQASAAQLNVWSDGVHFVVDHGFEGSLFVEVLDATGRLHLQRQVAATPGRVLLPAAQLNNGIWFVRLTHGQQQKTCRVPLLR